MSLNFYIGKENLPKDKEFIFDIEANFYRYGIKDCELSREIIELIERGKYLDDSRFIDRFGTSLYLDELSTSSKALLTLVSCKDKVLNFDEVGARALKYALENFKSGNIYVCDYYGSIDEQYSIDIITNDNEHYDDAYYFNEDWGE